MILSSVWIPFLKKLICVIYSLIAIDICQLALFANGYAAQCLRRSPRLSSRAAPPFGLSPKRGAKTLLFPGAKRATPYGVPDGAELVEENTVLLMQIDGGRRIFTLSPVAGTYFRRRPAYLHQIVPRQNAPSLSRSDRMQKLKAGQPKTITKGKRGVEIAERQFRLTRSHKQDKSAFSPLLCAYKRGWPADDKLPTGRNPRRPNAGLRFGRCSASEIGFFLAGLPAEGCRRLAGS